jgi:hypothetical protein
MMRRTHGGSRASVGNTRGVSGNHVQMKHER